MSRYRLWSWAPHPADLLARTVHNDPRMKVAAVLSTMCLVVSLAFAGGLKTHQCSDTSTARSAVDCRQVTKPSPAAGIGDASAVADQFVVLSFI